MKHNQLKPSSSRRKFLSHLSWIGGLGATGVISCKAESSAISEDTEKINKPLILSTWNHKRANEYALNQSSNSSNPLDMITQGINQVENDPKDMSVGYGGRPDRDGEITLDACVMDHMGGAGSVCYLQGIKNPISVARKVMETTPHVILAGKGAQKFALANGFVKEDLHTEASRKQYQEWLKTSTYKTEVNIERHDTIGMLAIGEDGKLAGGCSTSGMSYKLPGRVGDSPIIGAGLFVDGAVGAATATGVGELVLKTLGAFLIVELIRQGKSPQEACEEAINRIITKYDCKDKQVGFIAMDKYGNYGAYAIYPGFIYTATDSNETVVNQSLSYYSK